MGAALAQAVSEIRKPTVKRERIELFSNCSFPEVGRAVDHPNPGSRAAYHVAGIASGGANDRSHDLQYCATSGTTIPTSTPLSPMPSAANAAPSSLRSATWAAAMPLPATPAAGPGARQSLTFSLVSIVRPTTAATMPPTIASAAVRAGIPPIWLDTAAAMG